MLPTSSILFIPELPPLPLASAFALSFLSFLLSPLNVFIAAPKKGNSADEAAHVCGTCNGQLTEADDINSNHWRCLNDSMWSQVAAVQVMAWRLLKRLDSESWAQDLLDMMYLEDDTKAWAESGIADADESVVIHKDCNGATLAAGDTVVITKDLNVKGTSFTAKRGTAVRGISLTNNPEHIEGRVNGTRIVILTCFVKKA